MLEESQERSSCTEVPAGYVPIQAESTMKDFEDVAKKVQNVDVNQMILQLNTVQRRIFDNVTSAVTTGLMRGLNNQKVFRLYVSGEGGTGKSRLVQTIRSYLKQVLSLDTAVTAPTGIAAFSIDGLTVYRVFRLPVEHSCTPQYKPLSHAALKIL